MDLAEMVSFYKIDSIAVDATIEQLWGLAAIPCGMTMSHGGYLKRLSLLPGRISGKRG